MTTVNYIYVENQSDDIDNPLHMAWCQHPGAAVGVNLCVFREYELDAVDDLVEAVLALGFGLDDGLVVASLAGEYSLSEFKGL